MFIERSIRNVLVLGQFALGDPCTYLLTEIQTLYI